MSSTTGTNAGASAAARVVSAFNRHGAFTARTTEMGLAVELREVDGGALLAVVWLPGDGIERYVWLVGQRLVEHSERAEISLQDLVVSVASSLGVGR